MARPKKSILNQQSKEVIEKNFLEEDPQLQNMHVNEKVVVVDKIPEFRTIIFNNMRDPGITLEFPYASGTHPLKIYKLFHGQEVTLPLEVINHLEGMNKYDPFSCHKRLYGIRMRPDGKSETFANQYVPYFQCKEVRKAA